MTWWRSPVRHLLSQADEAKIVAAIRAAESKTSGEIRVHIERRAPGDPLAAAWRWFRRLGMEATAERNGVLIYVAVKHRAFAIVGDAGIHEKVGDDFWSGARDALRDALARGDAADGIVRAIEEVGARLALHFPRQAQGGNELPDEISYR
jgi:uncharacterized membrane protein